MEIKIDGNPGTGNTFQEIHIGTVQNYNPNATTVINYNGGTHGERGEAMPCQTTDKGVLRQEILKYVEKTLPFVLFHWKDKYMDLWSDILNLMEVDAVIYKKGRQLRTDFNRKELCHIICYIGRHAVDGYGIFENYNASRISECFGDGAEKSTRPELGFKPSKSICSAIDQLLKTKKFKNGI